MAMELGQGHGGCCHAGRALPASTLEVADVFGARKV
jgi:hypothetical protein